MQARVGLVGAVAWLAGCLTPAATTCEDGTLCSGSQVCGPAGGCVDPAQLAACDGKLDGDACDFGLGLGQIGRVGRGRRGGWWR